MKPIVATCLVLLLGVFDGMGVMAQTKGTNLHMANGGNTTPKWNWQSTGDCEFGNSTALLHANDVMVDLHNRMIFIQGKESQYEAPAWSGKIPVLETALWIGGKVGEELRTAGAIAGNGEFWPGPLLPGGTLPNPTDCSYFDRIWVVSERDITQYEQTGEANDDLLEWPAHLGAPVIDGDGIPGNYSLVGGDRPEVLGHQTAWWVMNDVGGQHEVTGTVPIGLEVQVSAYALAGPPHVDRTTFYRFRLVYHGSVPLTDAYIALYSDPDVGYAADDYMGSDTTLNVAFMYNAVDHDEVYGVPPAVGYALVAGPETDGERLGMTAFIPHFSGLAAAMEPPTNAAD